MASFLEVPPGYFARRGTWCGRKWAEDVRAMILILQQPLSDALHTGGLVLWLPIRVPASEGLCASLALEGRLVPILQMGKRKSLRPAGLESMFSPLRSVVSLG